MGWFNMSLADYGEYVKRKSPNSKLLPDMLAAFAIGGLICCVGQALLLLYKSFGLPLEAAQTLESVTLVALGVYSKLAKHGGAGTLVPITGFANAVVSPALEYKTEGYVLGTAAKMFTIAGPVIVYGVGASIVYGIILWCVQQLGLL